MFLVWLIYEIKQKNLQHFFKFTHFFSGWKSTCSTRKKDNTTNNLLQNCSYHIFHTLSREQQNHNEKCIWYIQNQHKQIKLVLLQTFGNLSTLLLIKFKDRIASARPRYDFYRTEMGSMLKWYNLMNTHKKMTLKLF